MKTKKIFATAINCMDGRVQLPVIKWLCSQYHVDYVDMITEPGPERVLAEGKKKTTIQSIRKRFEISVKRHNSSLVAIVGHYDCAGNPVNKDTQLEQVIIAVKTLESWNLRVQAVGLWIDKNQEIHHVK